MSHRSYRDGQCKVTTRDVHGSFRLLTELSLYEQTPFHKYSILTIKKTNISNLSQIDAPPSHNLQTTLSKTNVIFVNMRPLYSVVGFDYLSRLPRLASHWLSAWHPPDPTQDPLPPWMEHRIWLLARCVTTILRSRSLISLC